MRKRISLALAVLLVMSLCAAASAEPPKAITIASITFTEGNLEFADADNIDIDFGDHPVPMDEITYGNTNAISFSIVDARNKTGSWDLKVRRTGTFSAGSSIEFDGELSFEQGTVTNPGIIGQNGVVINGVTVEDSDALVIRADENQKRGVFHIQWDVEAISLDLLLHEALSVVGGPEYTETLTWTLEAFEE